jgi:hypothetical protein
LGVRSSSQEALVFSCPAALICIQRVYRMLNADIQRAFEKHIDTESK